MSALTTYATHDFPLGEVRRYQGHPSKEVEDLPYYDLVPKDPYEQLKWRLYVRERGRVDPEFAAVISRACTEDPLFFVNTFLFVFEPREKKTKDLPFNSWEDQDDVLVWMEEVYGERECGVEKSRGVGLSFIICAIYFRHWLFFFAETMGLISKDDQTVDSKGDMDSLMSKLDYFYKWMPDWLRLTHGGAEKLDRAWSNNRRFLNVENDCSVYGYGATGNTMTGGRKTSLAKDEFGKFKKGEDTHALASTQHVSNNRYFISTYKGNSNEFFRLMDNSTSTMLKIVVDWKDNPERSKGMYTSAEGVLQLVDEEYWTEGEGKDKLASYDFILDGKMRSPWYDKEWRRPGATPRSIAEELDRDPAGSVAKMFGQDSLRFQKQNIREADYFGFFDFDDEDPRKAEFMPRINGQVRVWMPLNSQWRPTRRGPFTMGIDIATGSGGDHSSNSAIEVLDQASGEQLLEFFSPTIRPEALGRLAAAIAYWLCDGQEQTVCYIVPEMNAGVAEAFREELMDKCGWRFVYMRKAVSEKRKKKTKKVGYWNVDRGAQIFEQLDSAMLQGRTIVRSQSVLDECGEYEWKGDKLVHVGSDRSEEDAVTGAAHGDCAIAYALAWLGVRERPKPQEHRATGYEETTRQAELELQDQVDSWGSDDTWSDGWEEYADQPLLDGRNGVF